MLGQLSHPRIGGGWSKVPTSVSTAASWLRSLVGAGSGDVRVGTHSCKCTVLSWMAKYGSPASDRRLLAYHVPRKDKSLVIYAREALAAPLRVMDEVLRKVASSEFMPDLTASGMLASSVQLIRILISPRALPRIHKMKSRSTQLTRRTLWKG